MTFRHLRNVRGFLSDYYLGTIFASGRRQAAIERASDLAYARFRRIWERVSVLSLRDGVAVEVRRFW